MTTNTYFSSNYFSTEEQNLVDSLMTEAIFVQGYDIYYMPRESVNFDYLFGEDAISNFKKTYKLEAYIKDYASYSGEGQVLSKLGLDVRDELTIQVSINRFNEEITTKEPAIIRPREGDLVYFGLDKHSIFEITFTENKVPFFQLGSLYIYQIEMKRLVLGAENIETGIAGIDEINASSNVVTLQLGANVNPTATYIENELVFQYNTDNITYRASGEVVSFVGGVLTITDVFGEFTQGLNIIGQVSGAEYTFPVKNNTTYDDVSNNKIADNKKIAIELEQIDVIEPNPFIDF